MLHFPAQVGDVDVNGLYDGQFDCPVWPAGDADAGATAAGEGLMGGSRRTLFACE
jgi:hypothetical protein